MIRYPCPAPGCAALLEAPGYCRAHARGLEQRRGSSSARGYAYRWTIRAARFRRQYPLCGQRPGGLAPVSSDCAARGLVTPATLVDHVRPHQGDPALFWDELGNWQSLCPACHARKTRAGL